ncbi:hypothetical protein QBC40DRAFT_333718 [Triangularia verruculosa]|uniref:Ubiquitin interaction domain-containing protein n=1 Tax=Triangularia verruculosa TaxID=2587418 RepID=A0AAN7AZ56_9PEZI|nr:hypothetical protein QBC40DRAFT_333718 [Triangularia verruculosa]
MAELSGLSAAEREAYDLVRSLGVEWPDDQLLIRALKHHKNNIDALVNEWFQLGPEKWITDYRNNSQWSSWDEMPGLEATETSGLAPLPGAASSPSFRIEGEEVLYGQNPGTTTGAPTRPPSRNTAQDEYDQNMQKALQRSLEDSVQPLRPSSPAKVHFGLATRDHYEEDNWATTTSQFSLPPEDEVPSQRIRRSGLPAFLRRRPNYNNHMLGGLLVILQRIPAARNALLQTGAGPAWGYQCTKDWWKGEPIVAQGQCWEHEVHRLMAFLEGTNRSYATADMLAQIPEPEKYHFNDEEREFFRRFVYLTSAQGVDDELSAWRYSVFTSEVEVAPIADSTAPPAFDQYCILDLLLPDNNYEARAPKTLYDYLDLLFYPDAKQTAEDINQGTLAMVSAESEIMTVRFAFEITTDIDIPEVFYLDRYLKANHERIVELSMDQITLFRTKKKATSTAESRGTFIPSSSDQPRSRQELAAATLKVLRGKIEKMRKHALWRNYDSAYETGQEAFYLPFSDDEPLWSEQEKRILAHYNTRIEQLERVIARTDELTKKLKETVLDPIDAEYEANAAKFTTPSEDEKWNPTHSYLLVGAVIGDNQVLVRWDGELLDDVIQESSSPEAPDMGGWWLKVSYQNRVEYEFIKFKSVVDMWNKSNRNRMLVYATESAMKEKPAALSDKLQKFVKDDNHFFKRELDEHMSKEPEAEASRKRGVDDEWAAVTGSGKLQRSASMDTLASDRASVGSQKGSDQEDEDMLDVGGGSVGEKGVSVAVQEMVERRTSSFFPSVTGANTVGTTQGDDATGTGTSKASPGGGDGNSAGSAADPMKITEDGDGMVTD